MDSSSSDEASEISDSELDDYEQKAYALLKSNHTTTHKIFNPDRTLRCPFCAGKKKQSFKFKDLLQHATGIGASLARKGNQRAIHLALARFLKSDIGEPDPKPEPSPEPEPVPAPVEEKFVWPWSGIIANVPMGQSLEERFSKFKPIELVPLYSNGNEGLFVVMRFEKDWSGFKDVVNFENSFKALKHGKDEWMKGKFEVGKGEIYGWQAREDDYRSGNVVGEYLKRIGKVLTIAEVEKEEAKAKAVMVEILSSEIEARNEHLMDMECKYNLSDMSLRRIMDDKKQVHFAFNEKMRRMQSEARDNARRVFEENEKLRMELNTKRKELYSRCRELDKLEAQSEAEKKKLDDDKQKADIASMVQKQADEEVLKLVEEQKREKEAAIAKILEIEKNLDHKQQLELDIEQLKGQLLVLKHLEGEEDAADFHEKMENVNRKLEQEREELEALQSSLVKKERESNDELQEARKELITGLEENVRGRPMIGIKRMGELDDTPFRIACKRKFPAEEAEEKAVELCSGWQEELKDPSWHPYKIVESNGNTEEVVDESDEKLKRLWVELGDDVYNAVKTALLEINEYNPSGRYSIQELWNFKENRKATMKEAVQYLLKQWKVQKSRR